MLNRVDRLEPRVGQWYTRHDKGEMLQVVAIDASSGCIETQYFDGAIEEIEYDAWMSMDIEASEAPEDWTGPFDDLEQDDIGLAEAVPIASSRQRLIECMEGVNEPWVDADAFE